MLSSADSGFGNRKIPRPSLPALKFGPGKINHQIRSLTMAASAVGISKPRAVKRLTKRKAWNALKVHYKKVGERHLRQLFEDDPKRAEKFTVEAVGIYFDYSKNRITEKTLRLLLELAEESGLRERIDAMFHGEKINVTENRAVLHVALRAPKDASIVVDGKNVVAEGHSVLGKMANFSNRLRSGT